MKAPLSFHFLSAGHDGAHAVCVTGRLNRATTWVPLEKSQSIRRVQGPLQRPLGLATVHVDVAGKRTRAEFRDREVAEADRLVAELTALSRAARLHAPARTGRVRRHRRRCRPQAGTPTRRAGTSSATGTRAAGPSTWPTAGGEAPDAPTPRREAHREVVDGADARRVDERVAGLDLVVGDALVPLAQRDPQLQAGQVRPQAAVDAAAEGDVAVHLAVEAHLRRRRGTRPRRCWPSRS